MYTPPVLPKIPFECSIGNSLDILTISVCKEAYSSPGVFFVPHRFGDTTDDFFAGLAVGLRTGHLKSGTPYRGGGGACRQVRLRIGSWTMRISLRRTAYSNDMQEVIPICLQGTMSLSTLMKAHDTLIGALYPHEAIHPCDFVRNTGGRNGRNYTICYGQVAWNSGRLLPLQLGRRTCPGSEVFCHLPEIVPAEFVSLTSQSQKCMLR